MSEKVFVPLSLKAKAPLLYRTVLRLCREGERHKADKLLALYGLHLLAEDPTRYAHKQHVEGARFGLPQDVGSFSLRACQGRVSVPWTDMKMREDAPEGAILKAVVKVESKQRRMRGTGRPRNHKSYLEERPTQVQSLNHSTKRGN